MTANIKATVVSLGMLLAATAGGEPIRLNDGTTYEGALGAPVTVTIKTSNGDRIVPFTLLPPNVQAFYWKKAEMVAPVSGPVQNDELAALAASVNLKTWSLVTAYGSFRDKPERRGTGGLVVTKAFNAIEENWDGVYPAGHALTQQRHWQDSLDRAKTLLARPNQYLQKRWLEAFIEAAEAVQRRDSAEFARSLRFLRQHPLANDTFALAN